MNNISALVQIMAWRWSGDKPLSEPIMVSLVAHICVTRPQWVNQCSFIWNKGLVNIWKYSEIKKSKLYVGLAKKTFWHWDSMSSMYSCARVPWGIYASNIIVNWKWSSSKEHWTCFQNISTTRLHLVPVVFARQMSQGYLRLLGMKRTTQINQKKK